MRTQSNGQADASAIVESSGGQEDTPGWAGVVVGCAGWHHSGACQHAYVVASVCALVYLIARRFLLWLRFPLVFSIGVLCFVCVVDVFRAFVHCVAHSAGCLYWLRRIRQPICKCRPQVV